MCPIFCWSTSNFGSKKFQVQKNCTKHFFQERYTRELKKIKQDCFFTVYCKTLLLKVFFNQVHVQNFRPAIYFLLVDLCGVIVVVVMTGVKQSQLQIYACPISLTIQKEFHMINITYAALYMRAQVEKTTFSCKDDITLTKRTLRWTYSALRYF